jgi:hypothetical protein
LARGLRESYIGGVVSRKPARRRGAAVARVGGAPPRIFHPGLCFDEKKRRIRVNFVRICANFRVFSCDFRLFARQVVAPARSPRRAERF